MKRNCLYEEFMATTAGIMILKKIGASQVANKKNCDVITNTTLWQCRYCVLVLLENNQKCPKTTELQKMVRINKEEGSIIITF